MKRMIDGNLGVISQEVEAQASELELKRKRKQAAKVIAIENEGEFDREYDAEFCNLDSMFLYNDIFKFNSNERYFVALYDTRCGYYAREEEIQNN